MNLSIYQLTCNLCTYNNSIYIGETSKTAYKRLVEHWLATCNKNVNLSSIAEHFNLYHNSHILSKNKPLLRDLYLRNVMSLITVLSTETSVICNKVI